MEVICDTNDITGDSARRFIVKNFDLIVVLRNGRFYAYRNECPHMNLPLTNRSKGIIDKNQKHLVCIQHRAEFDIENGICVKGPCLGMALEPVNTETNNGKLYLIE
jgi:nitrite reductase/ring-hydroxylating ferredoxin subunit